MIGNGYRIKNDPGYFIQGRKGLMEEIKIDCYLSPECPSEEPLRININSVLTDEKIKINVGFHRIDDDEAAGLGLSGSPSVFINGKELQPQGTVGFS
jgi:hypothetical protein